MDAWIADEATVRYYALIASFAVIAVWEALSPRHATLARVRRRWSVNIGLTLLLSVVVALLFPVVSVGAAIAARAAGIGLFNRVDAPLVVEWGLAFLALDLVRYATHALLHRVPALWRLHRVHHSDVEYDCTTALRFHPLEAVITVAVQLAVVAALGAAPALVLAFEVANSFVSLFSHGNLRLPPRVERALRLGVVTPDVHRIHHSASADDANANFGSILPWWDRAFGTYRAMRAGDEEAGVGLADVRDARTSSFAWLIVSPFERRAPAA